MAEVFTSTHAGTPSSMTLGSRFVDKQAAYSIGFYELANLGLEKILQEDYDYHKNTLVYAVCFDFRHYIELELKRLIEMLYYFKAKLAHSSQTQRASNGHDLDALLDTFLGLLNSEDLKELFDYLVKNGFIDENYLPNFKANIRAISAIDKSGQVFRYAHGKQGEHFKDEKSIDKHEFAKAIRDIHTVFEGFSVVFDEYAEYLGEKDDFLHFLNELNYN